MRICNSKNNFQEKKGDLRQVQSLSEPTMMTWLSSPNESLPIISKKWSRFWQDYNLNAKKYVLGIRELARETLKELKIVKGRQITV